MEGDRVLRRGLVIGELDKWLAWHCSAVLRGYSVKRSGDGWLLVVMVDLKGQPKVGFSGGRNPWDCWDNFLMAAGRRDWRWSKDKYA